jgi:GntR family transcriptional regulator/MocR family aminotransferase
VDAFDILDLRLARGGPIPLQRQLYDAVRDGVLSGTLCPGLALPSSRNLAHNLGVGRNTVIAAYEQLLSEGFLESRVGAGTRVAAFAGNALEGITCRQQRPARASLAALSARGRRLAATPRTVAEMPGSAFVTGLPALDLFPSAIWSRILARHHRNAAPADLGYAQPAGHRDLRAALARYLRESRGVVCEPDQIIVVCGAQAALDLAARMLLDAGDAVWMEEPGYLGARGALLAAGARLVPVPVDAEGLDAAEGERLQAAARLAYVTPSFQFPLGVTMSLARRLRLIEWAARAGAWILEDDYDSEYRYTGRPLSAMQGLDGAGRVVYLGTFSKTMFPALRIGYLVVPHGLQQAFATAIRHTGHSAPLPVQAALAEFIEQGHYAAHVRRMRGVYAARHTRFVKLAGSALEGLARLAPPAGGMQMPAWLHADCDDRRVSARAAEQGLTVSPMAAYYLGPPGPPGLYLGYAGIPDADVEPALRTLARVIADSRADR